MKVRNPIEYDAFITGIADTHRKLGIRVNTIREQVDKHAPKNEERRRPNVGNDIKTAAKDIIDNGEMYEYIYEIWQKRVKGNEYLGKALLASRGVQSCLNTKGVHVYAHGKHGYRKSLGMEKMIELIPPEYRMDEDVSPLAIHYASKKGMLLAGATLLIDEMIWNDTLGGIIKRIITRFQQGAGHLTVIDGEPVLVRTQPRLTIWTNSADLQADEQLRDRFFGESIAEGCVKDIIEFQKIRDTLPHTAKDVEQETAICQEILRDLAGRTFTVKIPFATRIKIEESEGTRGYDIFSDMVKGLTEMRYAKRKTDDRGQLLATVDDFNDAKAIYEGSKGHSEEAYTTAKRKVLRAIIQHDYKALYKDIKEITGMSEGRIKDIVNSRGRDEQKRHGLRYKCPKLDVNTVDISIVFSGYDRKTTHPVELSLPTSFNVWEEGFYKNLVSIGPDVVDVDPDVHPDVDKNTDSKDGDVVDVVYNIEREGYTSQSDCICSISLKELNCYVTTLLCRLLSKDGTSGSTTRYVDYVDISVDVIEIGNHNKEETPTGLGPHPRKDEPTPSPRKKGKIISANCGRDLTGGSQKTEKGKAVCYIGGCATPKRMARA